MASTPNCSTRTYPFEYPEQESNLQSLGSEPSRSANWRTWVSFVVPDDQDKLSQWTHPESHRGFRLATPASSYWTMSPFRDSKLASFTLLAWAERSASDRLLVESSWCALASVSDRARLQYRLGNQSPDFHVWIELRELESNQRPPSSEPGVTTNSNYPAVSCEPTDCQQFPRVACLQPPVIKRRAA